MITLNKAIQLANHKKYAENIGTIVDYPDRFVISYVNKNGEEPDLPPLFVMKETGKIGAFFPPNHSLEYLNKGRVIYGEAEE